MVDFHRDVYCLLGLPFNAVDVSASVQRVRGPIAQRGVPSCTGCHYTRN